MQRVENYEYELPSDFEDEEIDEELAFTEEDKKKYGAWFEKEEEVQDDGQEGELEVSAARGEGAGDTTHYTDPLVHLHSLQCSGGHVA